VFLFTASPAHLSCAPKRNGKRAAAPFGSTNWSVGGNVLPAIPRRLRPEDTKCSPPGCITSSELAAIEALSAHADLTGMKSPRGRR